MRAGEARVSVIVPTFDRLVFLRPALESVFAQTECDWELLVADDGSGPETLAYLAGLSDPRVTLLKLAHTGNPSRVRNAAIAAARGRYLAFLDSDDVWHPQKLARQLRALEASPESRWSYTAIERIDAQGRVLARAATGSRPEGWIFAALLRLEIGIAMPTVLAQATLVREVGGFDEGQRFGEFHDLCLRLSLRSTVVSIPETLCSVRSHDAHYSADREADQAGWLRLYAKMAGLAPEAALRSHCRRLRAETSVSLAAAQVSNHHWRAAALTLARALRFAWCYPQWWWGIGRGGWRALQR